MARRTPRPQATDALPPRAHAPQERWQHGTEPVLHEGRQQIARPVDMLRAKGSIGDAEVQAANRYYEDYAFGVHGAEIEQRGGSGGGVDGYSIAQIEALGRYLDVGRVLGNAAKGLLHAVIIGECSIRSLAGDNSRARMRLSSAIVVTLKDLADLYAKMDGARPAKASRIRAASVDQGATI